LSWARNLFAYGDPKGAPGCLLQEAVSKPAAKLQTNQLLAKGTNMSEQKSSFMASLDEWATEQVIVPLNAFWKAMQGQPIDLAMLGQTTEQIRRAIRAKVLESYRNGQAAGPRKAYPPQRRAHGL
jgi:hypothetical protein